MALLGGVVGNLCVDAVLSAELRARLHVFEECHTLRGRLVTARARQPIPAVLLLDLGVRVFRTCMSLLDHLLANIVEPLEVVTSVADLVDLDAKEPEVVNDRLLKLLLFLGVRRSAQSASPERRHV